VADCAIHPQDDHALVSCWNGNVYLVSAEGKLASTIEAGAPARLGWSADGSFAVAGTADGRLLRVERNGKPAWNKTLAVAEPPPIATPPAEVVAGLPIYQGGRIANSEHAYVGDIWVIKAGREAVFVDAGGTSGFATTQARLRALGVERVTHVLQTHTHGDHCGGAYLWRVLGAKIVGPKSAAIAQTWLMPMLTDYGIFPPRPLDVPLELARVGDEVEFEAAGLRFGALFVPGHSFDLTLYKVELGGRRVVFTGDLGFQAPSDILHRCWGDADKARAVVKVIREKVLPWGPEIVITGHGVRPQGMEFLMDLVVRTEESLAAVRQADP
jgi:glyoxylase-like metal-dependent hydrolase (beta-lactamase superfamily II)